MAGLYLIGFAAPAFEAAACHIGEMKDPAVDQPRAMWFSGGMASVFFVLIPVVWLGRVRAAPARGQPGRRPRPDLRPGVRRPGQGRAPSASWPSTCSAAPCSRCRAPPGPSSQLSEDGLLPRTIGYRQPPHRRPGGGHPGHGGGLDRLPAAGRPHLAGGGGQPDLPHRHRPAERGRVAAAPQRARPGPHLPGPRRARSSSAWWPPSCGWPPPSSASSSSACPSSSSGSALAFSGSLAYAWRAHGDRQAVRASGPCGARST